MKPRVFIASATESLDVAYALQTNLDHDHEVTVWPQGIFALSANTLDELVRFTNNFDFGIFVFTPDDVATMRDQEKRVTRDNVIFELGLFIGALGRTRAFIVAPRDVQDLHLPSDLAGIKPATYDPDRQDDNLIAATGAACNEIRHNIVRRMSDSGTRPSDGEIAQEFTDPVDIVNVLEAWLETRPLGENSRVISFKQTDEALGLASGSTESYIIEAAGAQGYRVKRIGKTTVTLEEDY